MSVQEPVYEPYFLMTLQEIKKNDHLLLQYLTNDYKSFQTVRCFRYGFLLKSPFESPRRNSYGDLTVESPNDYKPNTKLNNTEY